jgi:hypothetical protein
MQHAPVSKCHDVLYHKSIVKVLVRGVSHPIDAMRTNLMNGSTSVSNARGVAKSVQILSVKSGTQCRGRIIACMPQSIKLRGPIYTLLSFETYVKSAKYQPWNQFLRGFLFEAAGHTIGGLLKCCSLLSSHPWNLNLF